MKPLAVCAVFKNEAPFLLEWIAYHRVIGFDHFVLYDNDSSDGGAELVQSSGVGSLSTVVHWPRRPGQLSAYRHFICNLSAEFEWVAFIDLDEFLLPLYDMSIVGMLRSRRDFSAMLVHWRVFGPSGWEKPPVGLIIENYEMRAVDEIPVNRHVKSIVRCSDLLDVSANPHEFQVKGPVCDTSGKMVSNIAIQPTACHQNLVLNHYVTRSRQDWKAKIQRGSAMFEYKGPKYQENLFDHFSEVSCVKDETIKRFAPQVAALLHEQAVMAETVIHDRMRAALFGAGLFGPLSMLAHIQYVGDVDARFGDWIGMRGSRRWIEGLSITPQQGLSAEDIEYQVSLDGGTGLPWLPGGTFSGSRGLGIPLRGFSVRLRGAAAEKYRCTCSATFVDGSETGPIGSGQLCVAASLAPLEALRVVLHPG